VSGRRARTPDSISLQTDTGRTAFFDDKPTMSNLFISLGRKNFFSGGYERNFWTLDAAEKKNGKKKKEKQNGVLGLGSCVGEMDKSRTEGLLATREAFSENFARVRPAGAGTGRPACLLVV